MTQGPKLFAKNCASCHRYEGHNGLGLAVKDAQAASDQNTGQIKALKSSKTITRNTILHVTNQPKGTPIGGRLQVSSATGSRKTPLPGALIRPGRPLRPAR